MHTRIATFVLLVGVVYGAVALVGQAASLRLPGNRQGYEPLQPIAYSHRLHAGELEIPCQYCHSAADQSKHAGIPAASVCMNCHGQVTASSTAMRAELQQAEAEGRQPRRVISPELRKLYDALALDDDLQPDPAKQPQPIAWARVHELPDFARFSHEAHIAAQVDCQRCHGPVQTMERVRQTESLSMGWCVACHRETTRAGINGQPVYASTDCATCHY